MMIDFSGMTAVTVQTSDHGLNSILSHIGLRVLPARDAEEALRLVRQHSVDFAFADLLLPGMDGIQLLRQMQRTMGVRPGGALTCIQDFPAPETEFPLLTRPYSADAVRTLLPRLLPENRCSTAMLTHIEGMLEPLGIPAHPGRTYLCTAIAMAVIDPRLSGQLSKRLYPAISSRNGVSPAQVERAIRHCIDTAWKRGSAEEQYRLFGNTIDAQRGKPTVGQMIARSADIIRLEESL